VGSSEPSFAVTSFGSLTRKTGSRTIQGQLRLSFYAKLLDRVRSPIRLRHYSPRTEEARVCWIRAPITGVFDPPRERSGFRKNGNTRPPRKGPQRSSDNAAGKRETGSIEHLKLIKRIHDEDLRQGAGQTKLPDALSRKCPKADSQWGWQFVFPAGNLYFDSKAGVKRRHHLDESVIEKAIKEAVQAAGITKHGTADTFRHSFATQLLEAGYDIRTVEELLACRCPDD
jgi:integrase